MPHSLVRNSCILQGMVMTVIFSWYSSGYFCETVSWRQQEGKANHETWKTVIAKEFFQKFHHTGHRNKQNEASINHHQVMLRMGKRTESHHLATHGWLLSIRCQGKAWGIMPQLNTLSLFVENVHAKEDGKMKE